MKLYSWNTQKISVNQNGKIKTLSPFFLVSDEYENIFNNSSFTFLENIFNVEEMQNISKNIETIIGDMKDTITEKTSQLIDYNNQLENMMLKIESMDNIIKKQENIIKQYENMACSTENNYKKITDKAEEIFMKLENKQKESDEKIKKAEHTLNHTKLKLHEISDQAENKITSKYIKMNVTMENMFKKYTDELNKYVDESKANAEISKKWAAEPLNMPVEQGLYSARHYALLLQNRQVDHE